MTLGIPGEHRCWRRFPGLTAGEASGFVQLDDVSRAVQAYPTDAEGPVRGTDQPITARYLSPRVRALTGPILATLPVFERAR